MKLKKLKIRNYDCVIVSVGHKEFINVNIEEYARNKDSLIYDLKGIYNNKSYRRL